MENKKWANFGREWHLQNASVQHNVLDPGVYILRHDDYQTHFWLEKFSEAYTFDYTIYGIESKLIERIVKTYKNKGGNLGVLFNGLKGTGKSVTAEIICNKLEQPTIVVTQNINHNGVLFLSGIPQNVTIFIDEYEKVFGDSGGLLTAMDGALSSSNRRVFLFTSNALHINSYLLERPSRLRYLKTFSNLTPEVIEEIIDDRLNNKKFKDKLFKFILSLRTITIDIVVSLIDEVNIHQEIPEEFADIFNVKRKDGFSDINNLDGVVDYPSEEGLERSIGMSTLKKSSKFAITASPMKNKDLPF